MAGKKNQFFHQYSQPMYGLFFELTKMQTYECLCYFELKMETLMKSIEGKLHLFVYLMNHHY